MSQKTFASVLVFASLCVAALPEASAQSAGRAITHDDYESFSMIRSKSYSPDGEWLAYTVGAQVGDRELIIKSVAGAKEYRHAHSGSPTFTPDGKFVIFRISPKHADKLKYEIEKFEKGGSKSKSSSSSSSERPSREEMMRRFRSGRGRRGGGGGFGGSRESGDSKAPKSKYAILTLADGKVEVLEKMKSYKLPEKGADFLVYQLDADKPKTDPKADPKTESKTESKGEVKSEGKGERRGSGRRGRRGGRRGAEKTAAKLVKAEAPKAEVAKKEAKPKASAGKVASAKASTEKKSAKKAEKKPEDKLAKYKRDGSTLVLRNLADGKEQKITGVTSYGLTRKTGYLWYARNSKKDDAKIRRGLFARHLPSGREFQLVKGMGKISGQSHDRDETRMVFFSDHRDLKAEKPQSELFAWEIGSDDVKMVVSASKTKGFPKDRELSTSRVTFSRDGGAILVTAKAKKKDDLPKLMSSEKVSLDIWHFKDPLLQPQQAKRRASHNLTGVLHFDENLFVTLSEHEEDSVRFLTPDGARALVSNSVPYAQEVSWDGRYSDYFVLNTFTGERSQIAQHLGGRTQNSPTGRYFLYFEDEHWVSVDLAEGTRTNLTKDVSVHFDDATWDKPSDHRAHGIAGWTKDDKAVLIYDRFDVWKFDPKGGKYTCITDGYGRANQIRFRYTSFDREERFIPADKRMLLTALDTKTMDSGYYFDQVEGFELPKKLMMMAASVRASKAKNADRLFMAPTTYADAGNVWAMDMNFENRKQVTDFDATAGYRWGNSELVEWRSLNGKPLKGILVKPDGFDPNKKYPMMVYFYERNSTGLHRFNEPKPGTSPSASYYVSNGYLWFVPDIHYRIGYPGESAIACIVPGVQALIAKGFVQEDAVGAAGHSWGGYQTAYMVTQTDIFAAVESGAPVSNMTSAYGGIRWSSGMSREFQYEKTQSRIGGTLWDYPMRYLSNSPVFMADKVNTPVLMLHNDQDGAVPWYQGIEYFCGLRRLGKEVYMFNYNGAGHGLRKRQNTGDWTRRMSGFFDHHLKGKPMPKWMAEGVAYENRAQEKLDFNLPKRLRVKAVEASVSKPEAKPASAQQNN